MSDRRAARARRRFVRCAAQSCSSSPLHALIHQPDALKRQANVYQLKLRIPDCTGGG